MVLRELALFSGVGMLSEGVRAGLSYLGVKSRTVCHIEREGYAASVLVARMQEGSLEQAPIWSDVLTFDAKRWLGSVDIVVAGFPCTDLSIAGKRAGLDGEKSGLFFEIPRIASDCGARYIFLENVSAIATAKSSVMDETEGALDERAAARVVGELADCGWDSEWITLSASDVGASHGRARWFCLAWRMDDAECPKRRSPRSARACGEQGNDRRWTKANCGVGVAEQVLDDSDSIGAQRAGRAQQGANSGREELGHTGLQYGVVQQWDARAKHSRTSESVGKSESIRIGSRSVPIGSESQFAVIAADGPSVADASCPRLQGTWRTGGATENGRQITYGSTGERCSLFAPGPSDPRWPRIIATFPWLAPALESTFRGVVNGLAFDMGDSRAARLKCVGNGVVPLCAATAFVILARRAGIFEGMK